MRAIERWLRASGESSDEFENVAETQRGGRPFRYHAQSANHPTPGLDWRSGRVADRTGGVLELGLVHPDYPVACFDCDWAPCHDLSSTSAPGSSRNGNRGWRGGRQSA